MKHRYGVLGVAALVANFALFAAGILIDSNRYRPAAAGPVATTASAARPFASSESGLPAVSAAPTQQGPIGLANLAKFALTFTPLNVGMLCILAGLIGGCASRITYVREDAPAGEAIPEDAWFRTESPLASMLRSFLVYVAIVAGVSISTDGAFMSSSAESYMRFAATASFFAFVVGYDPSKFREWIDRTPRAPAKKG